MEINASGKHTSLLQYGNNYCRKKFYGTGSWDELLLILKLIFSFLAKRAILAMVFALTNLGNVRGRRCRTKNGFQYFAFYKIPFANPPTGSLRFALPQPVEPWTGLLMPE
jgi:hypothetical protein